MALALRRRPTGWFWNVNLPGRPQDLTSLRGDGPPEVPVVEADTGVVIGTVDGEPRIALEHVLEKLRQTARAREAMARLRARRAAADG